MRCLTLALVVLAAPAAGRTLEVGAGKPYPTPSAAARAAQAGDRIVIAAGSYRDCAQWRTPDLSIEAEGAGPVVIFGPVCADKALFVVAAPRITITGITFDGAVAMPGNGAGIRAEGGDLTIRRGRFIANQNGILTAAAPAATLRIEDSEFIGNGAQEPGRDCAHALYVGDFGRLVVTRSRFEGTRRCHHLKSRARLTEITETQIIDGANTRSSYLVEIPNGGNLLLARSTLSKGPGSGNSAVAVAIGAEGVRHPTTSLRIEQVEFTNLQARPTAFVRNWTGVPARLVGNRLRGSAPVTPLLGPGSVR